MIIWRVFTWFDEASGVRVGRINLLQDPNAYAARVWHGSFWPAAATTINIGRGWHRGLVQVGVPAGDVVVVVAAAAAAVIGRYGAPHDLESAESVVKAELTLALDQEPAIDEQQLLGAHSHQIRPELGVVAAQQARQELYFDADSVRKNVVVAAVHESAKAHVAQRFVLGHVEERREQIAHALHVHAQVFRFFRWRSSMF